MLVPNDDQLASMMIQFDRFFNEDKNTDKRQEPQAKAQTMELPEDKSAQLAIITGIAPPALS